MTKVIDLTGQKFGKWTVIKKDLDRTSSKTYWLCNCDCGTKNASVESWKLRSGNSKSCGCLMRTPDLRTGEKFGLLTVIKKNWY
jgi:hypothetical protein